MELRTTTFAWRRARCLADKMINSLYLLTYPARVRIDETGVRKGTAC